MSHRKRREILARTKKESGAQDLCRKCRSKWWPCACGQVSVTKTS